MRKMLVLPIVMSMFVVNSVAFGATARSARNGANTNNTTTASTGSSSAPVAARAAIRGAKTASTTQSVQQKVPVAARAATRNTPNTTVSAGVVSARAGAKQKVINMGTKVESATANTIISEECQNAYYGCMDSFCMLDNISGGRCQCSNRHAELENVLADIMKLDEQSLLMATEGVERLQMGQNADEIMARAKAAADQVTLDSMNQQKEEAKKKRKTLDLSSWTSLSFDDEEDDIFDGLSEDVFKDEMAGKTGDSLHAAANKLCKAQVPTQCQASTSMLQLTYVQKIKSDCSAYENSLKQQRTKSADKLREAQQALRETALEQFQYENKYDLGGCVLAFKECMQTTGGCGDDFSGCVADTVTLAIDENQDRTNSGRKKSTDFTKTKSINTGVVNINIDAATYGILESKGLMCESVLNQCVKVRDGVWEAFLRDVAPTIKTAQVNAESNRRMNCVTVIANCVKNTCGSKWNEESDNYDACINDFDYVKSTCDIEAQKCGNGTITDTLFLYVQQKISAMKVDRCTTQIKECLQSETACGKDYLGCIGLPVDTIYELCPEDKLTSCMDRFSKGDEQRGISAVKDYVVQVAKGLVLNIDNAFAKACQDAVDEAMIKVCGDTETCEGMEIDNSSLVDGVFSYRICLDNNRFDKCYNSVEQVSADDINQGLKTNNKFQPYLYKTSLSALVKMDGQGRDYEIFHAWAKDLIDEGKFDQKEATNRTKAVVALVDNMNQNLELILSSIENDATVKSCKEGRFGAGGRFPNITNNIKQTIGIKFYSKMMNLYNKRLSEMETKRATDAATLVAKYTTTAEEREQACLDIAKQKEMALEGWTVTANAVYNKQDSTCEVKWVNHTCVDWDSAGKCDTGGNDHFLQNCSITYNMVTGGIAVKEECGEEYKN